MEILSAGNQLADYMKLLVTELQNQNPLEPMDNQQMAAQLAQFAMLQQSEEMTTNIKAMNETMEKMNSSFDIAMLFANYDYARSLLGRQVSFYSGYYEQTLDGPVERLSFSDGQPVLEVKATVNYPDGTAEDRFFSVRPDQITGISE